MKIGKIALHGMFVPGSTFETLYQTKWRYIVVLSLNMVVYRLWTSESGGCKKNLAWIFSYRSWKIGLLYLFPTFVLMFCALVSGLRSSIVLNTWGRVLKVTIQRNNQSFWWLRKFHVYVYNTFFDKTWRKLSKML